MTEFEFAARMDRIETSPSAVMTQRAREMKEQGRDVISLSSGQPDINAVVMVSQTSRMM